MKSAIMKGVRLLFFAWVVFALISIGYNTIKIGTEYRQWGNLTDTEKRQKIFGSIYTFLFFIHANTEKSSKILVYSQDIKTYYLSKYYLYPRIVTTTADKNKITSLIKSGKFSYLALYNTTHEQNNYYTLLKKNKFGSLYKLDE